jgi:hypothetical protein
MLQQDDTYARDVAAVGVLLQSSIIDALRNGFTKPYQGPKY